jgi:hypothetical protein
MYSNLFAQLLAHKFWKIFFRTRGVKSGFSKTVFSVGLHFELSNDDVHQHTRANLMTISSTARSIQCSLNRFQLPSHHVL